MKTGKICLVAVLTLLCSLPALCLDLETEFRRDIMLYHIRPDQARSLKRDANGTAVSEERLEEAVRSFYDWLYPLGPSFLKRFNFKQVVFKDSVYDHNGKTVQRRILGSDLFLDADLEDKQFYPVLFYSQLGVMPRIYLNRWNNLNPDGFSYESSRGSLTDQARKKLDAVLAEWDRHFVSRTGMYSTEMDMALTFAYMIMKGPDASAFVRKNSPTVQKKFELMIEILDSVKAIDRVYMETLMAEDLSALKTYSPQALSVRLFREYSGDWGAEDDGTGESFEETAGRDPDEPVEVAGRKVRPLILALETNDMRLFTLLMREKADPNVSNAKNVSALMLAIANNEPEQVKLLLEAGANVTQEAARAGSASGVNDEIAKRLKAYLPGVRQMDAPEKKKPARASGADPSATGKLNKTLNEQKIDHLDLEDVALRTVFQFVDHVLADRGCRIRFVVPPKYAEMRISLLADRISVRDLLRLVCIKTGLETSVEEPDKVVLSEPKTGKGKTERRGGSDSAGLVKLNRTLDEEKFDHVDFQSVDLISLFRYVYAQLMERGCTIYFSIPLQCEDERIAVSAENVSLRDLLRLICRKTGLEMSLEEPNIVIFSEPKQRRGNAGSENGSAKKKQ